MIRTFLFSLLATFSFYSSAQDKTVSDEIKRKGLITLNYIVHSSNESIHVFSYSNSKQRLQSLSTVDLKLQEDKKYQLEYKGNELKFHGIYNSPDKKPYALCSFFNETTKTGYGFLAEYDPGVTAFKKPEIVFTSKENQRLELQMQIGKPEWIHIIQHGIMSTMGIRFIPSKDNEFAFVRCGTSNGKLDHLINTGQADEVYAFLWSKEEKTDPVKIEYPSPYINILKEATSDDGVYYYAGYVYNPEKGLIDRYIIGYFDVLESKNNHLDISLDDLDIEAMHDLSIKNNEVHLLVTAIDNKLASSIKDFVFDTDLSSLKKMTDVFASNKREFEIENSKMTKDAEYTFAGYVSDDHYSYLALSMESKVMEGGYSIGTSQQYISGYLLLCMDNTGKIINKAEVISPSSSLSNYNNTWCYIADNELHFFYREQGGEIVKDVLVTSSENSIIKHVVFDYTELGKTETLFESPDEMSYLTIGNSRPLNDDHVLVYLSGKSDRIIKVKI